jgi:hypothetical protein
MPVRATCILSARFLTLPAYQHTSIISPAAEALVEIECCCAVPQLHIWKPFCYNIQKRSVQSNCGTYTVSVFICQFGYSVPHRLKSQQSTLVPPHRIPKVCISIRHGLPFQRTQLSLFAELSAVVAPSQHPGPNLKTPVRCWAHSSGFCEIPIVVKSYLAG